MRRPKAGTFTVALTIIGVGVALLMQQFGHWHWDLLKYFGPAVLIILGLEIIWMRMRHDDGTVRYSGMSFVLAALAVLVSVGYTGVLAFAPGAFGPAYSLPVEGELPVTAGIRRLEIDLPIGQVLLRGSTGDQVRYNGQLPFPGPTFERARELQDQYWTAEQHGDTLVLRLVRPVDWAIPWFAGRSYLNVEVPAGLEVSVRTRNSRAEVDSVEAERLTVRTSNASVMVTETTGDVSVTTSNASVTLRGIRGPADVSTSNASVNVRDVDGALRVSTSNSAIVADSQVGGDWTLSTSNSSVSVNVPADTDAVFQASTSSSRVSGNVKWDLNRRETGGTASLGAGTHRVTLSTSNGAIRVNTGN